MISIRQMTPSDINAVAPLDVLAFTAYARKIGHDGDIAPRTRQNLLASLSQNPTGCFVAEADQIVGFIFTHVWGTTGWIGTFGVHPDCRGQGVGRSLLDVAVDYSVWLCTSCWRCQEACPSGVNIYELMMEQRRREAAPAGYQTGFDHVLDYGLALPVSQEELDQVREDWGLEPVELPASDLVRVFLYDDEGIT
ncbi:MAG: GNAT family N-acetyltransferase [Chloroflexi bacterium]|nr:GNAT family N-acetyltransferase [Chloroflexota bacterium]